MNDRIVTCAYCGQEYPDGTPTSQNEALTEHIKNCEKHPMRDLEAVIASYQEELRSIVNLRDNGEMSLSFLAARKIAMDALTGQTIPLQKNELMRKYRIMQRVIDKIRWKETPMGMVCAYCGELKGKPHDPLCEIIS